MALPDRTCQARPLGAAPLTDGQAVTVLVAVGLDLVHLTRAGRRQGRLQPSDVVVDPDGRPRLVARELAYGGTPVDTRQAWLRLAWALAAPGSRLRSAVAEWSRDDEVPLAALVAELLELAAPEPLAGGVGGGDGPGGVCGGPVSRRRRGQHAARRRWWGRGRRSRPG